jgi:hypothetical protein
MIFCLVFIAFFMGFTAFFLDEATLIVFMGFTTFFMGFMVFVVFKRWIFMVFIGLIVFMAVGMGVGADNAKHTMLQNAGHEHFHATMLN